MANSRRGSLGTLVLTATLAIVFCLFSCPKSSAADSLEPSKQISTEAASTAPDTTEKAEAKDPDSTPGSHCHISQKATYKKVSCDNPHAACAESERVIETLKLMSHLYSEGKFDEYEKFIDNDVTTFDEKRNKLIVGKAAVVEDMKTRWNLHHANGTPIINLSINHPYAQVTGDQAVVTFEAVKTIGGKVPETMSSRCTDIFVKKDGTWKKLHYRSNWKKCKPAIAKS